MHDEPSPPDDVLAFYGSRIEADRLARGEGALEFARTREILSRFLPAFGRIADIGGGTGRYAEWLAELGYEVDLVEPVPLHVELARERAGKPPRFRVHSADARRLPFDDESFDAALVLGPLYHLGESADRAKALAEAARICRPGAVIAAAAISRYAPLLDSLRRGLIVDPDVFRNIQAETAEGRRVAPEDRRAPFPDAYFHLPEELEDELGDAGLDVQGVLAVEGLAVIAPELDAAWENEVVRERLLWVARFAEEDPRSRAVTPHLLGVARKPTGN
jgi:SAM-dependent methyltransferase